MTNEAEPKIRVSMMHLWFILLMGVLACTSVVFAQSNIPALCIMAPQSTMNIVNIVTKMFVKFMGGGGGGGGDS
ncbi:hypothetical protein CEXT_180631 [Caerostris extrusa]|uniref:Uncharacterized protein n=1 Tax=Caerostris extrusa TaxID=172846 RepID=A0AAV4XHW2_CAEEX|nr:hypothetical protein CEXT_180631 [Caerostris extrusa]